MRWLLLGLMACNKADTDTGEDPFCADKPVETYENFGQGFMLQNCQICHTTTVTGDARNGAPESIHFDDEEDVAVQVAAILGVATGPSPIMPPSGGVSDDLRERLEIWLRCYPPEAD
jgi:uncharacterized membrane protein